MDALRALELDGLRNAFGKVIVPVRNERTIQIDGMGGGGCYTWSRETVAFIFEIAGMERKNSEKKIASLSHRIGGLPKGMSLC